MIIALDLLKSHSCPLDTHPTHESYLLQTLVTLSWGAFFSGHGCPPDLCWDLPESWQGRWEVVKQWWMGFLTPWVGQLWVSVLQGLSEWPCGVKPPSLSTVEMSLIIHFYGLLSLPNPPTSVSWNHLPSRQFLKILSLVLFLGKSKLRQEIGMEKQW